MPQFRKKPVVIEAMQFDGTVSCGDLIARWANDARGEGEDDWFSFVTTNGVDAEDALCHTLEGDMQVSPGDFVIRGVKGEFYPCKPDIFALTYEDAQSSPGTWNADALVERAKPIMMELAKQGYEYDAGKFLRAVEGSRDWLDDYAAWDAARAPNPAGVSHGVTTPARGGAIAASGEQKGGRVEGPQSSPAADTSLAKNPGPVDAKVVGREGRAKEASAGEGWRCPQCDKPWKGHGETCGSPRTDVSVAGEEAMAALASANEICRSAYNIAHRISIQHGVVALGVNFDAFKWRCKDSLALQHRVMYPDQYTEERRLRGHDSDENGVGTEVTKGE